MANKLGSVLFFVFRIVGRFLAGFSALYCKPFRVDMVRKHFGSKQGDKNTVVSGLLING